MKVLILFLLLVSPILINAQAIRIPDPVFRQRLIALGYDENDNGKIEVSEVKDVTDLDLTNLGIVNLEGINSFTNLQELQIPQNKIAKLDVSKLKNLTGLYAWDNPLTDVNVTGLTKLKNLYVHNFGGPYGIALSYLKTLDVSTLTSLEDLRCSNNRITGLDVSGLQNLQKIECKFNLLKSVNLTKAPNLKSVDISKNPLEITVDIRGLVHLEYFNCKECNLLFLNMSGTVSLKELIW